MTLIDQLKSKDKNLSIFHLDWDQANIEYKELQDNIQELELKIAMITDEYIGLKIAMQSILEQKTERIFLLTVHMNKLRQERKGIIL